jgi:hypothetical protein
MWDLVELIKSEELYLMKLEELAERIRSFNEDGPENGDRPTYI